MVLCYRKRSQMKTRRRQDAWGQLSLPLYLNARSGRVCKRWSGQRLPAKTLNSGVDGTSLYRFLGHHNTFGVIVHDLVDDEERPAPLRRPSGPTAHPTNLASLPSRQPKFSTSMDCDAARPHFVQSWRRGRLVSLIDEPHAHAAHYCPGAGKKSTDKYYSQSASSANLEKGRRY